MLSMTVILSVAAMPAHHNHENSPKSANLIIKEWQITRMASDGETYTVTGAFNLSTQQFSGSITAYKPSVGTWPEYSCGLSSGTTGSTTQGGNGVYVKIISFGSYLTVGTSVTINLPYEDQLPFL